MQDADIKDVLKNVGAYDKKTTMFVEVLNLRAYVNRLLARITELEKDDVDSNFFMI